MNDDKVYVPAVKTNVEVTFRRFGYTPPSELPEYQAKWAYYKALALREVDQASSATAY